MPTRGQRRLAKTQKINSLAGEISNRTHFTTDDCKALLSMHERMTALGKVDRLRFRELLHCCFGITDDIMLDLTFRAFDRNSDGIIDDNEFIIGLSSLLRGDLDELIDFCYFVYDMNGDKSLAREELFQCLKGCIVPGFGIDVDEIDDAEKDVVEIVMRKLDTNKDGQITFDDFQNAVHADPILVQSIGPCLPTPENTATFLSTVTEHYRAYAGCWTDSVDVTEEKAREKAKNRTRVQSKGEALVDNKERFTVAARKKRSSSLGGKGRATTIAPQAPPNQSTYHRASSKSRLTHTGKKTVTATVAIASASPSKTAIV